MQFAEADSSGAYVTPLIYPYGVLRRDNWDDYTYKTTFGLTVYLEPGNSVEIGQVKIMTKSMPERSAVRLPGDSFASLDARYCALGQSLSYYENVVRLGAVKDEILSSLRDAVYSPVIAVEFEEEAAFKVSLLREGSASRALKDGPSLFFGHAATELPVEGELSFGFVTSVGGSRFVAGFRFGHVAQLPTRINAIIGYNGSGKTRLLANLAMVASADLIKRREEKFISDHGQFVEDVDLAFGSTVAVSYSAFDTFSLPGQTEEAREILDRTGEEFGYVYCGLRKVNSAQSAPPEGEDRLKTTKEIEDEFFNSLEKARQGRRELLSLALNPLLLEPSFARTDLPYYVYESTENLAIFFKSLSTGHKIVLHIVVQLVAHLERRSLVLIDEPESHLHPPLLAALLKSLGVALKARDSFAIVSTHSPVVLQEIPRSCVHVIRRYGNVTSLDSLHVESFGENIGSLTRDVFDLDSSATDYHSVLEELSGSYTFEQIESFFGGAMSPEARAFVYGLKRREV